MEENSGVLFVVSTPIGNLKDITFRAVETIQQSNVIVCEDTRKSRALLQAYNINTKNKKILSFHQHSPQSRIAQIKKMIEEGKRVSLLTDAGTPGVSDPGILLINKCIEAGLKVSPIPGPSAVLSALVASGADFGKGFLFLGYLPALKKKKKKVFQRIKNEKLPVVVFESPRRIKITLQLSREIMPDKKICICREMTKLYEEFIRAKVAEILPENVKNMGEMTIVFFE